MVTVREALGAAAARFAAVGIDTPSLDAQVLLAFVLGVDRAWLLAHPEAPVAGVDKRRWTRLVGKRVARQPVAYLIGQREFYGLAFTVDQRALVPRPETELLVERGITLARAWRTKTGQWPRVADIGTGSGAIAVSLAVSLPDLPLIYAVDRSQKALNLARHNAQRHGVDNRIRFRRGDLLAGLPEPMDMILANLPYIPTSDLADLPPEVQYEPPTALDGGPWGLHFYQRLFNMVGQYTSSGAVLLLEIGADQGQAVARLAETVQPDTLMIRQDLAGLDRLVEVHLRDSSY